MRRQYRPLGKNMNISRAQKERWRKARAKAGKKPKKKEPVRILVEGAVTPKMKDRIRAEASKLAKELGRRILIRVNVRTPIIFKVKRRAAVLPLAIPAKAKRTLDPVIDPASEAFGDV